MLALWLALCAGCPGEEPPGTTIDASMVDAGRLGDGGTPGSGGLVFDFEPHHEFPDDVGSNVVVDGMEIHATDLRAFGDSAPGDARTTAASLDMAYAAGLPAPRLTYPMAPPGLYSRLDLTVASYHMTGTARGSDNNTHPFDILDTAPLSVSVALVAVELVAGTTLTVPVDVRPDFVSSIDWSSVTPDAGGVLRLTTGDPRLANARSQLATSIGHE
jgi:hypothetical protein